MEEELWGSDSEDDRPRYAFVLEEEEYEDEGGPQGVSPLQDNFEPEDPTPEIEGWDPRSHEYYFQIQ